MTIASRVVVFDVNLRHLIQSNLAYWIEIAKNDPNPFQALREAINAGLDDLFNELASLDHFEVIFTAENTGQWN